MTKMERVPVRWLSVDKRKLTDETIYVTSLSDILISRDEFLVLQSLILKQINFDCVSEFGGTLEHSNIT